MSDKELQTELEKIGLIKKPPDLTMEALEECVNLIKNSIDETCPSSLYPVLYCNCVTCLLRQK